jgi:hypothetical protein
MVYNYKVVMVKRMPPLVEITKTGLIDTMPKKSMKKKSKRTSSKKKRSSSKKKGGAYATSMRRVSRKSKGGSMYGSMKKMGKGMKRSMKKMGKGMKRSMKKMGKGMKKMMGGEYSQVKLRPGKYPSSIKPLNMKAYSEEKKRLMKGGEYSKVELKPAPHSRYVPISKKRVMELKARKTAKNKMQKKKLTNSIKKVPAHLRAKKKGGSSCGTKRRMKK